jgi:hypothetical protein
MNRMMAMVQGGRDPKAMAKKMKEVKETDEATLLKILTPEQTAKLKELQGAPCPAAKKLKDVGF